MEFGVCAETLLLDRPYEERMKSIAACGFKAVEFWFLASGGGTVGFSDEGAVALRQACSEYGLVASNMVVNSPDGDIGGAPVRAADLERYLERLEEVIAFCCRAGITSGITCSGNLQTGLSRETMRSNLEEALGRAADSAARHNFTLLLEPLNTYVNHAGYYLDSSSEASEIIRGVGSPRLKLLYDIYHMQIMEGNLMDNISRDIDITGHFHAAGVPGRGEVSGGEIAISRVVKHITDLGYDGFFALEYTPSLPDHEASLRISLAALNGGED